MIRGNIEILQSYGDTHRSLYKGPNMVVDGMRETIADVMTYMPNPSANATETLGDSEMPVGVSSVSSYQIQAMTLGSAQKYYSQRDSRFWMCSGISENSINLSSYAAPSAVRYQLKPYTKRALYQRNKVSSN